MTRWPLMLRGPLIFRRIIDDDWLSLGPLIITGTLFFFFWRAQMVRGAPTAPTFFFVGFRTYFVTSLRVSVASVGVLVLANRTPARARKPQGGAHLLRPLGYVPATGYFLIHTRCPALRDAQFDRVWSGVMLISWCIFC